MKKVVAMILALSMVFALCGCGETSNSSDTAVPYETIQLKEQFVYQDFEITLDEASVADHVMVPYGEKDDSNVVHVFRPVKSEAGNKLIILSGTIKNTGSKEQYTSGTIFADFVVDGADTYSGKVTVVQKAGGSASTKPSLPAQMDGTVYVTAEIPETVADSFTACDVILGFHKDGFDTARIGSSMSDTEVRYKLAISKDDADNPILVESFEPITYHLGDQISTETIELKLDEIILMTEMKDSYKGKTFLGSHSATEGSHNICLVGTMMSKATRPLTWTDFSGNVEIDGYTYELEKWVLDGHKLQPMFETKVYLFATIPDTLLENFDACTFKFAFNEEMSNLWYEYEECDYSYIFTLGPADIANGLT